VLAVLLSSLLVATAAADANSSGSLSAKEQKLVDQWLAANQATVNKYGDAKDSAYTGGSPLFDEKTGKEVDLYDYIQSKHPDKPWSEDAEPVKEAAAPKGTDSNADGAEPVAPKSESTLQAAEEKTTEKDTGAGAGDAPPEATTEDEDDSLLGTGAMIVAALAAVGVAAAFFAMNGSDGQTRRKHGSAVLILGASNSGKTSLFLTLKDGSICTGTTTSMQENEGEFVFSKYDDEDAKPLHVIDYPGDPSLSFRLPDFYPAAKAIVFVVDANDKKSIEREAAEMMYRMLTHPSIVDQSPSIIVACNKSELILHSKPALLKKIFESELQKLTITQGSAEDAVNDEGDDKESIPLGIEGENFEFDKHSPCSVEFVKCSIKSGDLKDLATRIREATEM